MFTPHRGSGLRANSNGLSGDDIADLRSWAQAWAEDINHRLYAETYVDDGDDEIQ